MQVSIKSGRWRETWVVTCLALAASGVVLAQGRGAKDVPDGPAPTVEATETAREAPPVFRFSADPPAAVPNHPPIHLIPPMPMPAHDEVNQAAPNVSSGLGKGVLYDPTTRRTTEFDATFAGRFTAGEEGLFTGGGFRNHKEYM